MKFKFKIRHYFSGGVTRDVLEYAKSQNELVNCGRIVLDKKYGYSYAAYIHGVESVIDHNYYEELSLYFDVSSVESVEIFVRCSSGSLFRSVATRPDRIFRLTNDSVIRYSHDVRGSRDLVVYFDYSRLVSKVILHDEYLPKFGFKSDKDILVIGNAFGYWGTSCLFGNNGEFLFYHVVKFIDELVKNNGYERIFFVGGSQGATAALVYASAFPQCAHVHAACPVDISKKNMLLHMKNVVSDSDVDEAKRAMIKSIQGGLVSLYATVSDVHYAFNDELSKISSDLVYQVCVDPKIGHGDCLRYYIKDIYSQISSA